MVDTVEGGGGTMTSMLKCYEVHRAMTLNLALLKGAKPVCMQGIHKSEADF